MAMKKYLTTKVLNVGRADAAKHGAIAVPGKLPVGHLPIGHTLTLEVGSEEEKRLLAAEAIRPATQEVFEEEKKKQERPPLQDDELESLPDLTLPELQEFAERKGLQLKSRKKDDVLAEIYKAYDIEVEEE